MSLSIADYANQEARPSFVRFVREAVEDPIESRKQGFYVAKDEDFALVTAQGSKDVFKQKVDAWKKELQFNLRGGRIKQDWYDAYLRMYNAWKAGEEIPVNGTPIKGWGMISPAMQQTLIHMSVVTVEDLAALNDEGVRRCGLGGVDLKTKAIVWLRDLKDRGPVVSENARLTKENDQLRETVAQLHQKIDALAAQVNSAPAFVTALPEPVGNGIGIDEILGESPDDGEQFVAQPRARGRPRKHVGE